MVRNKSKLVEKVIKTGIVGGLSLLPVLSNGQSNESIQKGVNAATLKGETKTHFIYEFKFNEDLKRAIKNSQKPHLYTTGVKDSYVKFNGDSSAFELYYPKASLDESGKGKTIGLTIRDGNKVGPCDSTGLGSRYSPLPSLFWTPDNKVYLVEPSKKVSEEPEREKNINIYNINETNITNNITNNYPPLDMRKMSSDTIRKNLEFRILLDGGKRVNPLESPFWEATINPQLGRNWLWFGPYATAGFGSENSSTETPVYKKILLSQAAQIFTETEGTRTGNSKKTYPMGFGGKLSLNTNDNRVRFDLSYGLVNERKETSGISESGYDRKLVGDQVIEEKPYGPIYIEEGKKCSDWVPTQGVGIAFQPFKKVGLYTAAEAQHIGKISSKKGDVNFNVKAGLRFGGRKK